MKKCAGRSSWRWKANKDGTLLYIGISNNHINRLFQHSVNAMWFKEITRIELEHFGSRKAAIEAERLAIITENPLHNKAINSETCKKRFYDLQCKAELVKFDELIKLLDLCSHENFKAAREAMKYGQSDLARMLKTPLRTVQDWEAGKRRIPGVAAVAVGLLVERDARIMARISGNVGALIARDFPHGIDSAPDPEE